MNTLLLRTVGRIGAFPVALAAWLAMPVTDVRAQSSADSASGGAVGSTYQNESLAPTTAAPWNPAKPTSGAQTWEQIVRFPGRVLSLPLSLLGGVSHHSLLFIEESSAIPRTIAVIASVPTLGLVLVPADLGERTGLGGRVGWFPPRLDDWLLVDMSGSFGHYHRGRVNVGKHGSNLDYQYDWRPKDRFYGPGPETSESDASQYAVQTERWKLELVWPPREGRFVRVPFEVAAWGGHREAVLRTGRGDDVTSIEIKDPVFAATRLDMPVGHLIYGGRITLDRRTGIPHWGRGFRVSWSAERYDTPINALAIKSAQPSGAHFTRYEMEVATAVSFWRDPRTIRIEAKAIDTELTDRLDRFLPSDLAILGGGRGLAGFEPQRWSGIDAVVSKISYVFPLQQHFEFDIHMEAGSVYDDLQRDARWNTLQTSYGVAFRQRTKFAPLGFIGVDWSRETVRFRFSFGAVE